MRIISSETKPAFQPTPDGTMGDTLSLRSCLRLAPVLAPEDSVRRFVQLSGTFSPGDLPVIAGGQLQGMLSAATVLAQLRLHTGARQEELLRSPVSRWMEPVTFAVHPDQSSGEVREQLIARGLAMAPVVDERGYCLGVIRLSELFSPVLPPPRPPLVGGMATPFGVYLTDGTLQAGAGNAALVATGATLCLLFLTAFHLVGAGIHLAHRQQWLSTSVRVDINALEIFPATIHSPLLGLTVLGLTLLLYVLFLSLMRVTRMAGYHAAEHQVVHAMERGELLIPEIVARMPRAHPRCGTNLMAAVLMFATVGQALSYVPFLGDGALLIALLTTAFTWKRFGAFLQERFTTRVARRRELEAGITAATELLAKYEQAPPSYPRPLRRLWCMGMLQVAGGSSLVLGLYLAMLHFWH